MTIKIAGIDVVPIASHNVPLGYVGLPYPLFKKLHINIGDIVPLEAGGLQKFFTMWAPPSDWVELINRGYKEDEIIVLNENTPVDFNVEDKKDTLEILKKPVVVCRSLVMSPSASVFYGDLRTTDTVRKELNLLWGDTVTIGKHRYIVKPALRGDLDALEGLPPSHRYVFMHKDSIPDNIKYVELNSFKTDLSRSADAMSYLETLFGPVAKGMQVDIKKKGTSLESTVTYQMWTSGRGRAPKLQDSLNEALKFGLRQTLETARDRINDLLTKIPE